MVGAHVESLKEKQQREADFARKREQDQRDRETRNREMKETLGFDLYDAIRQQQRSAQPARSQSQPTSSPPPPKRQPEGPRPPYTQADLEQDLGKIIGLENVKQTIRDIYAQVTVQRQRVQHGIIGEDNSMSLHMLFLGNQGTGKTMVARLVGTMFERMGVLSKGHFVETDCFSHR